MGFLTGITNLPPSDDGAALGSATLKWSDLFLASGGVINWDGSDVTITHSSNTLTLAGGNLALGANSLTAGALLANSNDVGAIGASGTAWSDLFLASGAVINFFAGDVTITHSANALTLAGGTLNVPTASSIVAGTSTSNANLGGVLSVNTTAVGNVGTGDDDLMTYTLPANTLNADGRTVRVTAWGTTAGSGDRYVNAYFGAQVLSGNQLYASAWQFTFIVVRTGATTQEAITLEGKTAAGSLVTTRTTPSETLSGTVVIKMVGNSAAGGDNDIVQRGMLVEVLN